MSAYRRIADAPPTGAEGRHMTQSVNREFFGLDRIGLQNRFYRGPETSREQTLPAAITD
jgi:hypothetical protein